MSKNGKSDIEFEKSNGNVFADLALDDADELYARGLMGLKILDLLDARGLKKQKDIVALLDIKQPEVSLLINGEFSRFSEARLMAFLKKLDHKVVIQISPRQEGEPYQQVAYAV